jgi:hypothetical protein
MTDTTPSLALLRRQVAALLSEIDTATLPRPDKLNGRATKKPGCEWKPRKGWSVFTIENGDSAGMVYLDHECDDIDYRWGEPGDWESLRIEDARAIGLAFLAAAARAEELFVGVTRLPERQPVDGEQDGEAAQVREFRSRR